MKRTLMTVSIAIGLSIVGYAHGQTCDKTFVGGVGEPGMVWQRGVNWNPEEAPNATDVACIPADKVVVVDYDIESYSPDAVAEAIVLQGPDGDPLTGGQLLLEGYTSLTLQADSTINGYLQLQPRSQLILANSLKITGNGGQIEGLPGQLGDDALITEHAGASRTLQLIGVNNSSRSTSMVLRGALDVRVGLSNRGYVIADKKDPLILSTTPKRKYTGYWIAEYDPLADEVGHLWVNVEVSGGGTWQLVDRDVSATISINAPCPYLTGDVLIENGVFIVNQSFTTTGQAIIRSVGGEQPTRAVVNVAEGKAFTCSQ